MNVFWLRIDLGEKQDVSLRRQTLIENETGSFGRNVRPLSPTTGSSIIHPATENLTTFQMEGTDMTNCPELVVRADIRPDLLSSLTCNSVSATGESTAFPG